VENGTDRSAASTRAVEIGVAAVILLFGLVIAVDSFRLGARWGEDGPLPGYFPFYVGLLICLSSTMVLLRGIRNRALARESFVSRGELGKILVVLVPSIVYVGIIAYLGFYVASVLFIAYFMRRLGKYSWFMVVSISVGVIVAFFLTFEIWFAVPLPKGPLEAALGLG
jgi:putative tricarboxylic transport membrane protein